MENARRFLIANPDTALEIEEKILTKLGVNGRTEEVPAEAEAPAKGEDLAASA